MPVSILLLLGVSISHARTITVLRIHCTAPRLPRVSSLQGRVTNVPAHLNYTRLDPALNDRTGHRRVTARASAGSTLRFASIWFIAAIKRISAREKR